MRHVIENFWVLVYDNDSFIQISEFFEKIVIETELFLVLFHTEEDMNIFIEENHLIRINDEIQELNI